ncbi:MAG: hypothetical protein AAGI34_13770 [Pseudomonadota bacterium]
MSIAHDPPHKDLILEIEGFCEAFSMAPSRLGSKALGDPSFVRNLLDGRECLPRTLRKVRKFMAEYEAERAA